MIRKVVRKSSLKEHREIEQNLVYWLSRTPEERVEAVEELRRQRHGNTIRLERVARVIERNDVAYLIVGAHALAYHGAPRYTGDLDILVQPNRQNAARILQALGAFGFDELGLTQEDFAVPDKIVQLGVAPERVDIITSLTGVSWKAAVFGSCAGHYGDISVRYLGKGEFVRNKRALGRAKDLADIETLGAL